MYVFSVSFQLPCWGDCPWLRMPLLLCAQYSTITRYHYSGTITQGGGGEEEVGGVPPPFICIPVMTAAQPRAVLNKLLALRSPLPPP